MYLYAATGVLRACLLAQQADNANGLHGAPVRRTDADDDGVGGVDDDDDKFNGRACSL